MTDSKRDRPAPSPRHRAPPAPLPRSEDELNRYADKLLEDLFPEPKRTRQ